MSKLKDSEQMLGFLNDLSKFTQTLGAFQAPPSKNPPEEKENAKASNENKTPPKDSDDTKDDKKTPQSPTEGIADEFIQNILESYLKKR